MLILKKMEIYYYYYYYIYIMYHYNYNDYQNTHIRKACDTNNQTDHHLLDLCFLTVPSQTLVKRR